MVTQSGMPSGMAATVRVIAIKIMYTQLGMLTSFGSLVPRETPTMNTITQTTIASTPINIPKRCNETCKGVWLADKSGSKPKHFRPLLCVLANKAAILPTRVFIPVATTTPLALPEVTEHPEKPMFSGVSLVESWTLGLADLLTSSDSPVSGISSTFKSWASMSLMSAGMTSPTPKTTMSPFTMSLLGITSSLPLRITTASGWDILDNASSALPAWFSVAAAMPAFKSTMTKMATPER
mmetsp:Transcript_119673/g.300856  ORF Transcript_119673/g.300856 Transcript_119673/m.300856 type:complete len:238 (+) Transcript_119673:1145-1858(+)